ncbi:hypothetical protein GOODEAATRI_017046 [Goodea atripinnis]|uniref:Peptidase M24 domain-containing protein n=1 Tax=Goodea atripinnis TaxID=208336 RepID=A0ABV0PYT9_9TELE
MSESEQFLKGTSQIKILSPEDIEGMRVVCKACLERKCYPSPLNYYNFPKSCCTSVNEVICHGIPDRRPLQDGDILNVKPGVRYRELGNIIQKHAQASSFSVVRSYCGHGIHRLFHTAPNVPHYASGWQDETWPDGWTAVTRDGKRSAQFEHTLLVTETGCEILTRRLEDNGRAHFLSQI